MDVKYVLQAVLFASIKHSQQRRKDKAQTPYINHPIEVANLLVEVGKVEDANVVVAALLHDTLEDTATTPTEIENCFGSKVLEIVQQVTDDKSLPKLERKRLQIVHVPSLCTEAKLIKLADKICNVKSVLDDPPYFWENHQRRDYLIWAKNVVQGLRGTNLPLEQMFDQLYDRLLEIK